jgi:hypothetical protein
MGYYLQTNNVHNKAQDLIEEYGGINTHPPNSLSEVPLSRVLVCVVDNGPFEAALVVVDDAELKAASNPRDYRPKKWIALYQPDKVFDAAKVPEQYRKRGSNELRR